MKGLIKFTAILFLAFLIGAGMAFFIGISQYHIPTGLALLVLAVMVIIYL